MKSTPYYSAVQLLVYLLNQLSYLSQKSSVIFCVNDMYNRKIPSQCPTIAYVH